MRFYLLLIILVAVGAALVVAGVAMWSVPAALIVAGVMLVGAACLGLMTRESEGEVKRP